MRATSDKTPPLSAFVLAFAAIYIIWGSTYLGMRVAIETMPPFSMAATRFGTAGVILLAIQRWQGVPWPTAQQWRQSLLIGTLLLLGGNGMVAWSEQYIPSGITALLIGASPIFFVLTEWAWPGGLRPTPLTFVGLALGFAGVAWLAAPWEATGSSHLDPRALMALLVAAVSWSIGSIYSRHAKNTAPAFMASALQMICGGLVLLTVGGLTGEFSRIDPSAFSFRSWTALAYLTIVGSLIGFPTFVWLMKHSTPARVSTYAYVNPVVAVALGWLVLDEQVTPRSMMAAAIIVAAVIIITLQKSRATTRPASSVPTTTPTPSPARSE